jgi:hypothetical protein
MNTNPNPQDEPLYDSVERIARRWDCSPNKAAKVIKLFRGQSGYMDIGQS